MDDSQQTRPSMDAAATRKRRSSILKNQRPPRAPLSEVEFNTTTPTDTAKSRRVSFSKRTGVAEFVTNEATTTWKTFYEEHNRTLELSGNDSEMKPRPSVGHISKRIFDQQFQDVEAIDFVTFDDHRSAHIDTSMNNVKFCEQLVSLECTADDRKLAEPQQRHELSTFTDYHSKVFSDELVVSGMCELTDRIGVNFSELQPLGATAEKDDLDEIQRDLQRAQFAHQEPDMCHGPLRPNFSEYIEVELNMTHGNLGIEESDMSITDTIHSPKVQDVSKSTVSTNKKSNLSNKDWVADKENIVMNPYVAPKESDNFAVVDKPDKVLVFDGKRLTIESEINAVPTVGNYRKTLLPEMVPDQTPQRKSLHLNMDDDLPNFIKTSTSICHDTSRNLSKKPNQTVLEGDLPVTKPLIGKLIKQNTEKRRTIVFDSDSGNVSMTQTLVTNIILSDRVNGNEKTILNENEASNVCLAKSSDVLRKTIVDETELGDLSVTQAVPFNIFLSEKAEVPEKEEATLCFDGDVSKTRAVSSNIMPEKRKTILYEGNAGDISVTQAISSNLIIPDKSNILGRNMTVNEDPCNISITDALSTNLIWPEKKKMIVYESDSRDIFITHAVPSNILLPDNSKLSEKRKTVYEKDIAGISMTRAVPTNIILPERDEAVDKRQTDVYDCESADINLTQNMSYNIKLTCNSEIVPDKRRTIVYESDAGDISVTQAIPANIILPRKSEVRPEKRRTIVFESGTGDISMTQAIPANIILPRELEVVPDERRTIDIENDIANISMTQAIPANITMPRKSEVVLEKRRTIVHESDPGDISITRGISANIILPSQSENVPDKRRTTVFENETANISMTQAIPNIISPRKSEVVPDKRRTIVYDSNTEDISMTQAVPANIILPSQSEIVPDKRRTIVFENETANISMTQAIPNTILPRKSEVVPDKRRTIVYESDTGDISMTQAIPANIILSLQSEIVPDKRRTIVFENETANISMTQAIPNIILPHKSEVVPDQRRTIIYDSNTEDISMTQAIRANIILPSQSEIVPDKRRTIVFENETANISMTQAIPNTILPRKSEVVPDKRRTIVHKSDTGDISMTQAIPANIILPCKSEVVPDKRKTIVLENETTNISMTQAIPNIILPRNSEVVPGKRRTIVCESDTGDISMSQAIPANIILSRQSEVLPEKRSAIVFENDTTNISMTQAIPDNIIVPRTSEVVPDKRRTIDYDSNTEDISMTQGIPGHIILPPKPAVAPDKRRFIVYERGIGDISANQAIPENKMSPPSEVKLDKRETVVYESDITDICMTQAKPLKTVLPDSAWAPHKLKSITSEHNNEQDSDTPTASSSTSLPFSQNQTSNNSDISGSQESGKCSLGCSDRTKPEILNKQNSAMPQKKLRNVTLSVDSDEYEMSATTDKPLNVSKLVYHETAPHHVQQDVIVYQTTTEKNTCSLGMTQQDTSYNKAEPITTSNHQKLGSKEVSNSCEDEESNLEVFSSEESNMSKSKTKRALLKNLLDMSNASIEDGTDDKNLMVRMASVNSSKIASSNMVTDTSGTSLIFVAKETEEQMQTDKLIKAVKDEAEEFPTLQPSLPKWSHIYDFRTEDDEQVEEKSSFETDANMLNIEKTKKTNNTLLEEYLKKVVFKDHGNIENTGLTTNRHFETVKESENSPILNRHFEKVVSPCSQKNENVKYYQSNTKPCERVPKNNKSFRDPDNTKDLLQILTDLVDKEDFDGSVQFDGKDKTELFGSLGVSLPQKRQSIVLSRETLMNNMLMAKKVLQKSQMNDSDTTEDTTINSPTRSILSKKSIRLSNEVVKKLQFEDDDSFNELQNPSVANFTSLKKTAFGDKAKDKVKESKANVIPKYLEDVSDDIKQLMDDLVKPMPDEQPFASPVLEKKVRKTSSICSTQVQANLWTSSQIDVTSEDNFHTSETPRVFSKLSLPTEVEQSMPGEVLLFDHNNPLNNVLLTPVNLSEAHCYNPFKPSEVMKNTASSIARCINDSNELSKSHEKSSQGEVTNFQVKIASPYRPQLYFGTTPDVHSISYRQPMPHDQSIDRLAMELKDYGVNTVIAMKANKELLEQSSSLTLVDDALTTGTFNSDIEENAPKNLPSRNLNTPGKLHNDVDMHAASFTEDSCLGTSSTDTLEQASVKQGPTKRSLSLVNKLGHSTQPSPEVTPKPANKIQKKSFTPNIGVKEITFKQESGVESESSSCSSQIKQQSQIIIKPRMSKSGKRVIKSSPKRKKPDTITPVKQIVTDHNMRSLPQQLPTQNNLSGERTTVQLVSPERHIQPPHEDKVLTINVLPIITTNTAKKVIKVRHLDTPPDDKALSKTILEALGSDMTDLSVRGVESSVSDGEADEDQCVVRQGSFAHTKTYLDRQPELANDSSSKDLVTECDSSVNVVAKIDMLPFMGSRDCEWDTPGGDSWAFRLLHGRLRLCVRLAHRLDNASRTIVHADTPVLAVTLDETLKDKSNPVGVVCVQFAADTMRHLMRRRCARAGEVPALLRLCAGVARVALRWGRAMQDAKLHLAYKLADSGALSLKVANIPLRSVWEVTMRLQLVADDVHETPWPRARDVRVAGIVTDSLVTDAEVQRALGNIPCDWGHAPRTLWKIFRYLKNKTRDVDL